MPVGASPADLLVADQVLQVQTPQGPARAWLHRPDRRDRPDRPELQARGTTAGALVLGHGAGGGVDAPDLVAATRSALAAGWWVALVEQPWRVAGRRVAVAPPRLDEAWTVVVRELQVHLPRLGGAGDSTDSTGPTGRWVLGGRSAGARVAARTCTELGAAAVLALAFPLHPPGRPERSRAGELAGAGVPVLVVQGERDAFGPAAEVAALGLPGVVVAAVPGDHSLRAGVGRVDTVLAPWLARLAGPQDGSDPVE